MNNFRITGTFYVSKAGNDSNNGTSPETPKATLSAALSLINASGQTIVIGSGTYEEAINRNGTAYSASIIADGNVVLMGDGTNAFIVTNLSTFYSGLVFFNYASVSNTGGAFTNCTFRNVSSVNAAGAFTNCILINISSAPTNAPFVKALLINCTLQCNTINNSYINGFSKVTILTSSAGSSNYNNLMGQIRVTTSGTYQYLADHKVSYPNLNVNTINASPLFNDSAKEDFTLQATSPHIGAASDGTNIGNTNTAKPFPTATAPEWQTANGAVWSNVALSANDIVVSAGQTSGTITSAAMLTSTNPVIINKLNYFGLQLFNKSKAGGTDTNKNVPDANMYAGSDSSGGGNPDRLTIEMRWVNQDSQPTTDADWKNGNLLPAGSYGKFVINAQPVVDNSQRCNGEPLYNTAVSNNVIAIWVQLRVTIRNDYA